MSNRAETVHRIFLLAVDRSGADRESCLREHCDGDPALRAEVEELLQNDTDASFLGEERLASVRRALGDDDAPPPERIGAFRVVDVIGRGGMGVVYRALQDQPAREVALKVLAPGAGSREASARFALEAEALGRLQHPGIAQIHAAGSYATPHGERPFLAMELVRGAPLNVWARERQPSLERRVALWVQICEAVHHAHQKGVIHRDLKPSNVLVDDDGRAKVLDFGIARFVDANRGQTLHTEAGQLLGTLAYMSPEQADGAFDRVDVRSDVYSLGALGYELLCGEPPIAVHGEPLTQALRRIVEQEPVPLGERDRRLRGDLQTIVATALRKEPDRRYPSAQALADDLRRHLAHEPVQARPATTGYVVRRFARRHRGLVAGVLVATLALMTGTVVSITWAVRADRAERTAQEEARVANRVTEMLRWLFVGANPEFAAGRDLTAKEILAAGRGMLEHETAADPLASSRVAMILGEVFVALGDTATGEGYIARAHAALQAAIPGDDDRLVEALHVHAWALLRSQRYAEAGPLYEQALAMHRRLGRAADVTVAKCLEGIAAVAARAGAFDRALRCLDEALPLREREADPLRLAFHWQNVANTNLMRGDLDAADAAFQRAVAVLPPTGSQSFAATIAGNIGNLRLRQDRLPEAEAEFRKSLQLMQGVFGPDSPRLLLPLSLVGTICAQTGRTDEAEQLLHRALSVAGDETTSTDGALANVLSNLGLLAATQEKLEAAVGWWQRAEAMDTRLRPGTPGHLQLLRDLATAKEMLGDAAAATELRQRADTLQQAAR